MKTTPKEEQVGTRLVTNFSYLAGAMTPVARSNQNTNWEKVRKTCVNFLDSGKDGIVQDMKELEEIATRKVAEKDD